MKQIHHLKTWPSYFKDVVYGSKTFEYRQDDRGFREGDILILAEYVPHTPSKAGYFTGEECRVEVAYILRGAPGLPDGYVVMAIQKEAGDG